MPPAPPPPARGPAVTLADVPLAVRGRRLLDAVTLHLPAGAFVGVVGTSGSGQSTLLRAVGGLARPTAGAVRLDGVPLSPAAIRADRRVVYLPQDVVVHEALTPAQPLGYRAELAGLGATTAGRQGLVTAALARVGLADRAGVPIGRLSGGQRKRAALAAELLGDPRLVLLDEPNSGLDPATDAAMTALFRSLADDGRTVLVVTHAPAGLAACDGLLVLADGRLVYAGPPATVPEFFGAKSLDGVCAALAARPAAEWAERFAARLPAARLPPAAPPPPPDGLPTVTPAARAVVLGRRYLRLLAADWPASILLLTQPVVIGLMTGWTFGDVRSAFADQGAADARQVLFVLTLAVLWCAGAGAVREVVKELAVVRHERRFGLDFRAYLASKMVPLGAVGVGQAAILLAVVRHLAHPPGAADIQLVVLAATAVAGTAFGLCVSATAGTAERAMTVLPVALIGMALFSGGLARLTGPGLLAARVGSPAYWAMDGLKTPLSTALTTASYAAAPGSFQPPILGPGGPLALDLSALGFQAVALRAAAGLTLRRRLAVE